MDITTFDAAAERLAGKITRFNRRVLVSLGGDVQDVTSRTANTLQNAVWHADALQIELASLMQKSVKDATDIISLAGLEANKQALAYFKLYGFELLPDRKALLAQNLLLSVSEITSGRFTNLSNTRAIGYRALGQDGRTVFYGFRDAYVKIIDDAITEMATGVRGFRPIYRDTLMQFADGGLRMVEFGSGRTIALDSHLRQSVLDGVRDIWQANHDRVGREFGADGVELSAHGGCAPDHLPYQGKQYSHRQFEKLQDSLERPIGMWNCRHIAFPVIMGISRPAYSNRQLKELRDMSERKVEFDGEEYTAYQGTQLQRKLESQYRSLNDRLQTAKDAGLEDDEQVLAMKLGRVRKKYWHLSKTFGLPYKRERLLPLQEPGR